MMTRNRMVVAGLTLAAVGTLGLFFAKHGSDGGSKSKTPVSAAEQSRARDAGALPTTGVTPPQSAAAGKMPPGPSDASDRSDASERPARANRLPDPALQAGNPAGEGMAAEGALDPDGMKDRYRENKALDERIGDVGPDGQFERVRVVKTDMKYPLVRVVERFQFPGTLLSQTAMVADHVTLKVKEGTTEAQLAAYAQAQGGTILRKLRVPGPGTYLVKFDKVTVDTVPHAVAAFGKPDAPVQYVNPDYVVYALDTTPNDPFFNQLWGMRNTGQIASTGTVVSAGDTIDGTALIYSPVTSGVTGMLYYCGLGNPGEFPAAVSNNIALIQRGTLSFAAKVANAKAAGAKAAIVYNNSGGPFSGTLATPGDWLPSLSIAGTSGTTLLARTNTSATVTIYGSKAGADINAPAAWDVSTGNTNIIVAVIDTGVDYNHPDLKSNMWVNPAPGSGGYTNDLYGYDFCNNDGDPMDDHFHGTHCAGTIGGVGNNGVGVAGVSWKVRIMALKFLNAAGSGNLSDGTEAIYYATAHGAKLTSNSWGGGPFEQGMRDAIDNAGLSNILFVAAAGNSRGDNDAIPTYPASYVCSNLIAVAATDCNDALASFSCYGQNSVDLGAPGVNIFSTYPTYMTAVMASRGDPTNYNSISGTSMATPHVAGACALMAAAHPELSAMQIKNLIMVQTDPIPALTGRCRTGGRLNIGNAVVLSSEPILRLWGQSITDPSPGGNGDGRVNPGETALITVRLVNASTNAVTAVTATIASPITGITIVSNTVAFGDMPGLTEIQSPIPFVITVATDCPPQLVAFEMVTTDGAGHAWTNILPVRVRGMSRISGTVRADGAPGIGFRVYCAGRDVDTGAWISQTVYSDINGQYAFDMPDGNFTVTASLSTKQPYIQSVRNIVTPPDATNVDFEATTVAISGRVTDAKTGNPLTNATVDYYVVGDAPDATSPGVPPASWPTFATRGATAVDANGNYTFSTLMMTTSIVSVTPWVAGYSNVTPRTVIVPANAAGVDFALSAPDVRIGIAPGVVARTVKIGQVVTQTLAIANSGGAGMPWTLWQESDEAYQAGTVVRSFDLKYNGTTDYRSLDGVAFDGNALNFNANNQSPFPVFQHHPTTGAYLDRWENNMNLSSAPFAWGSDWDGVNFLFCDYNYIRFVNPDTKLTVKSVRILEHESGLARGTVFGGDFLWILSAEINGTGLGNRIVKADRRTGATLAWFPAPTDYGGIEYLSGAVWCPDSTYTKICKVNPADGRVLRTFNTPAAVICDLAKDRTGNLWLLDDRGPSCKAWLLKVGAAAWLSSSATSGTVAAGGSNTVQLTFDSTTAGVGVHTAMVSVATSDPYEPEKLVPVLFTVTASQLPVLDAPASAASNPVILPATAALRVAAHDPDGDPLVFTWSQISGPGTTTFTPNGTAAASNSVAIFSRAGTYVLRVTASNSNANEIVTSDVTVYAAGIETDVASVAVPEGSTAAFRARLVVAPAASVTVTVARASGDSDITVADGSNLTFNSGNWADWQTVTLAATPDADVLEGSAVIALSADGLLTANVTATEREAGTILRVLAGTGGTVSPAGATNVLIGAPVTVAATPASGRCFARWVCTQGSAAFGNALAPTTTVTVAAAATIRANFGPVSGTAWAWGSNQDGQLGDGTTTTQYAPVMVKSGGQPFTNVAAVAAGWEHTVALLTDSNVWTWGNNDWGQLGDGTTTGRTVPGKVSGVSNVVAVAAGGAHTVALDSDGAVWTWGWNRNGQLGDGTSGSTAFRAVPGKVSGVSNVVAIACGVHQTIALKSDGSVWAWGLNAYGYLGDGTSIDRTTPVQVTGLSNVTTIVGSKFGGSALKNDGGVWTWGNESGMPTQPLYVPQPVAISDVFALSAGAHVLALKNDGSLWGWGPNYYGNLGNGVVEAFGTTVYPPVQSLMSNAMAVSAGDGCSLAIDSSGGVWSWGYNSTGQLGDGTTLTRGTPAKIAGSCDYVQVEASAGHCVAIRQNQTYIGVTASVSSVSVPEGGTNTFQVKLSAQPETNVTITVVRESGDDDILVTDGANLTFTSANWNTYQTVTLAAAEDGDASNGAAVIWLAGADYDARVTVTEIDNDATLTVYAGAGGTVSPNGAGVVTKGAMNPIAATPGAGHVFSGWSVLSGSPTIADTNAASTTVTITNDATVEANFTVIPTPTVLVSTKSLSVPEGGTAQFQVKLDGPPPFGSATVTVARASGDADISVQSGASLVFDAGNWSAWQTVTLAAAKDGDSVNGTAAIQCAGDSIIPATVTATELDTENPGEVRMQSASYVVNEAGGGVLLNVERVNGATGAASVRYATADGTATAGSDYVTTTGTLTWAAGETGAKSVVVPILDDLVEEAAETFGFGLSDVTGAALATPTNATVTILANDGPVWTNRLKIAFTGYNRSETLTNFPALVKLDTTIPNFTFANFLTTNGYDVRFWNDTETTNLNYEIEQWNTNGTSFLWVQVPLLTNNAHIWMTWSDSAATNQLPCTTNGAVWIDYGIVLHFGNATTLNVDDSSPYRKTYTVNGGVTATAGKIGGGAAFNGSSGWIDLGTSADQLIASNKTISVWAVNKGTDKVAYWYDRGRNVDEWGQDGVVWVFSKLHVLNSGGTGLEAFPYATLANGDYLSFSYTGKNVHSDRNGGQNTSDVTLSSVPTNNPSYRSAIGRAGDLNNYYFDGTLDEFRIARVARSANWVWAEYLNMASNGVFQSYTASAGQPSLPAAATGLTATAVATNRIVLGWTDNAADETGYTVERSPDGNAWALATVTPANATNYCDTGLAANTLHHYRVAAANADGRSAWAYAAAATLTAYEQWRRERFTPGELGDPGISGNNADPDGDGMSNINEFHAGTDPRSGASRLAVESLTLAPDGWTLGFASVSGKVYLVEYATDLTLNTVWNILPVKGSTNGVDGDGTVIRIVDPTALDQPRRFYRIHLKP